MDLVVSSIVITHVLALTHLLAGVGKGTIIDGLLKQYSSLLGLSVSHTTRKPRINEMEGGV